MLRWRFGIAGSVGVETAMADGSERERQEQTGVAKPCSPACPACGDKLIEIRAKLQCSRCHTIYETCCEGGRG
jgi:hypothetical protein